MTTFQRLILTLDGLTAGDYLAHARNPDPPGLGRGLRSVAVHADPLGDTVEAVLAWDGPPPSPAQAEVLAGLPMTPEVVAVHCRRLEAVAA